MKKKKLTEEEKKKIKKNNIIMDLIISIVLIGSVCGGLYLWEAGAFISKEVRALEGDYKLIEMKEKDRTTTKEELERLENSGLNMTLTIYKNGTGDLNINHEEANFKIDEKNIKYGSSLIPYVYKDGRITFVQNDITLVFEKIQ